MRINLRSYSYLLLWFGLIVVGSSLTPYFANDYRYLLVQGTDELVSSFSDIIVSQYRHYFEWGGRTPAHVIAQTLLWWGKPASAVAQAFAYAVLILFIYYNAYGIKPTLRLRFIPVFIITFLLFAQMRAWGEVVFNIVSSANYLWTTTIVLMFLLPYRISMKREIELHPLLLCPMMFVLGILAGWSNENTSAAVATGLGLYLIYCFRTHNLSIWQVQGYISFLIGFALLIFAPGNQARLSTMEDNGFDALEHTISSIDIFFESLLACILLLAASVYLRWRARRSVLIGDKYVSAAASENASEASALSSDDDNAGQSPALLSRSSPLSGPGALLPSEYHGSMWFIYTGMFTLFLMIFAPNFPARSATPYTIFTIIGIIGLGNVVIERCGSIFSENVTRIMMMAATLLMTAGIINAIYCTIIINTDQKVREAEILTQLEEGRTHLVVSPMHAYTYKFLYVADVRADKNYWTNKIIAHFLGVESIARSCDYPVSGINKDFKFFSGRYDNSECNLKVTTHPDVSPAQK
ncbi:MULTISPECIES: DUF6056 family protein [unclassified Anaerobiospirillum]|uniref:DUF3329 domain-containing protein n=1 Tax=unclassified Anaerobiospirillum TaxID=2647410 RepID=UPI001FF6E9CD|nr:MULTISPECIES: DUF6056 family protein [unclassified Anaerobiospirillum]MCK0534384.1 DUF6056 family protein [Anaerobiospirillum sp. NML120511]MCK0539704.1 DUF6056 family protein [Anaerobiospirillum sp. NML02-A-032]